MTSNVLSAQIQESFLQRTISHKGLKLLDLILQTLVTIWITCSGIIRLDQLFTLDQSITICTPLVNSWQFQICCGLNTIALKCICCHIGVYKAGYCMSISFCRMKVTWLPVGYLNYVLVLATRTANVKALYCNVTWRESLPCKGVVQSILLHYHT